MKAEAGTRGHKSDGQRGRREHFEEKEDLIMLTGKGKSDIVFPRRAVTEELAEECWRSRSGRAGRVRFAQ